jgi:murein L,D-transpeptidase YcbB/YkuD
MVVLALTLLLAAQATPPQSATESPPPPASSHEALRGMLLAGRDPDLRWPDLSDVQGELSQIYSERDWAPLWLVNDTLTAPARAMIQALSEAPNRGLDPRDYDADWLFAQAGLQAGPDSALAGRVELALSVATARFASALRFGRVAPTAVHATLHLPMDTLDLSTALLTLAKSREPNRLLKALEPPFIHYWLLMGALVRYRQLARDSELVDLPPLPKRLRPGDPYVGVPRLRRLLTVLGDYLDTMPLPVFDTVYFGGVVDAVKRFQLRQGFTSDGVVGDSTRVRLERPFEQRIRQMELTLERWRWMPRRFSAPPIIVNIPAFRLYAFSTLDLDNTKMLAMNVVVGTAFKTETPVFSDELEYLIFAPYWEVTPTISVNEVRPAALKNPEYLARNRFELVENGEVVPPWIENIQRIGHGVRVRQMPGEHNALGLVKFIMPNDYQVYLHDTPSKSLFDKTRRDASHGCIRLGDPFALAKFLLRDQPEWTDERIHEAMHAGEPTVVHFRTRIPVFIVYGTAVAAPEGDVYFYPDIYGHDRILDRLLRKGYPYPRGARAVAPVRAPVAEEP